MADQAVVNGRLMPLAEASVSVLDLGFLRGLGAFDTFRTYAGGHPHALAAHLDRIWRSAAAIGVEPCFDERRLRALISEARAASGYGEIKVNVVVTPGVHTHGVFGAETPTWVLIVREMTELPEAMRSAGVAAVTFRGARVHPEVKTTAYITGRQGLLKAEAAGAHEAFYVDDEGFVTEGVTSNVLARFGDSVHAPNMDCLPGITKTGIAEVARELGLGWRDMPVRIDALMRADEVWICSALRELLPVVRIDGQAIGDGRPGMWAERLHRAYRARCEAEAAAEALAS